MKRFLAITLSLMLFFATVSPAVAGEHEEPSEAAIIMDILIVRPLGLVSIAFGTGVFILALPFSIPTKTVRITGEKLVKEPVIFTFKRPVGELKLD